MNILLNVLILVGVFIICSSYMIMMSRALNCLIIVENLNSLLLSLFLMCGINGSYNMFLNLIVLLTVEVLICLSLLVLLWSVQSYMVDLGGY